MLADLLLAEMQAEEQCEALFADPRSDTLLDAHGRGGPS
jgi:hypothetical protein